MHMHTPAGRGVLTVAMPTMAPLTCLLTRSLTRSLTHSLARSLTHSLTAQAGAAARAERLREWQALAVGSIISGRDVNMALQELEELQVCIYSCMRSACGS